MTSTASVATTPLSRAARGCRSFNATGEGPAASREAKISDQAL
jgi:hypothetical protein